MDLIVFGNIDVFANFCGKTMDTQVDYYSLESTSYCYKKELSCLTMTVW